MRDRVAQITAVLGRKVKVGRSRAESLDWYREPCAASERGGERDGEQDDAENHKCV